jgi:hypothetical protein
MATLRDFVRTLDSESRTSRFRILAWLEGSHTDPTKCKTTAETRRRGEEQSCTQITQIKADFADQNLASFINADNRCEASAEFRKLIAHRRVG